MSSNFCVLCTIKHFLTQSINRYQFITQIIWQPRWFWVYSGIAPGAGSCSDEVDDGETLLEHEHARRSYIRFFPLQETCQTRPRAVGRVAPRVRDGHFHAVIERQSIAAKWLPLLLRIGRFDSETGYSKFSPGFPESLQVKATIPPKIRSLFTVHYRTLYS